MFDYYLKNANSFLVDYAEILQMINAPSIRKRNKVKLENLSGKYPEKKLPKGCEWYYFND